MTKSESKIARYIRNKLWDLLWAGGELLPIRIDRKKYDVEYHRGQKLVLTRQLSDEREAVMEFKIFFTAIHSRTFIRNI